MKHNPAYLSIILTCAVAGPLQAETPYIEFQGVMYGTNRGPEMGNLDAEAYTEFFDSVFTATESNMNFFAGENIGNLTLHIGDSDLGQAASRLSGFSVMNPGPIGYHDTRIYTGGDFALQWNNDFLVNGGSFVDSDVRDIGTTGGAIATVENTGISQGKNGADLVDEFNAHLANNSGQWIARFGSFSPVVQDDVGEYEVTLRLEPLLVSRFAQGAEVPDLGGMVDFPDRGVQLNFTNATPSEWGGSEVTVEQQMTDPEGPLPNGLVPVNDGQFWEITHTLGGLQADIEFDFDPVEFTSPEEIVVLMRETGDDPWEVVPSELVEGENRIRVLGQQEFSQWDLAIPEPSTYALFLAIGSLGCVVFVRRRR